MFETITAWLAVNWLSLANVIMIDVVLAGDNAIIVGLAASQVAPEYRSRVIYLGIMGAVVLRIVFALMTTQLLQIVGLMLAGGLLLLWVCWKMYRQLSQHVPEPVPHSLGAAAVGTADGQALKAGTLGFGAAVWQIIVADVSMSLDNVLAVAGAAKDSTLVLVIGLAVAVVLMAVASHYIAGLLHKYPAITWVGLAVILYVAFDMIYDGGHEVSCKAYGFGCQSTLWDWIRSAIQLGSGRS